MIEHRAGAIEPIRPDVARSALAFTDDTDRTGATGARTYVRAVNLQRGTYRSAGHNPGRGITNTALDRSARNHEGVTAGVKENLDFKRDASSGKVELKIRSASCGGCRR